MNIKYRPEIDGLRAIAVLAVVFYHAKISYGQTILFPGGFLGVDVFFVISGYLISLILLKEMRDMKFSLIGFYERRARRILPALYTVLLISIPLAWILLLPKGFKEYSGSMLSSLFFGSNIYFLFEDSYMAEVSALKPLLHTWSLAVEEQFYVFFPLLLFLAYKYLQQYLTQILIAGLIVSLLLAEKASYTSIDENFYLLHTRAWELLCGALLARFELEGKSFGSRSIQSYMQWVGLLLIIISVLVFNEEIRHPSFFTVIPVIGTMLVIWYSRDEGVVNQLLSTRGFVFFGLISYSLYLWHFPVLAYYRNYTDLNLSNYEKIACIIISLILSVISWKFVENVTRNRKLVTNKVIWVVSLSGVFILGSFSLYGVFSDGFPKRYPEVLQEIVNAEVKYAKEISQNGKRCINYKKGESPCEFAGGKNDGFSVITVGDSHIGTLNKPLLDNPELYTRFVPFTKNACLLIVGLERVSTKRRGCSSDYNEWRLKNVVNYKKPLIIYGGRFPLQLEGESFNNQEGGVEPVKNDPRLVLPGSQWSEPASNNDVKNALYHTLISMLDSGAIVVLLYPIPEAGWHVPNKLRQLFYRSKGKPDVNAFFNQNRITTSYDVFLSRTRSSYELLDSIPDHKNLIRIYPEQIFCKGSRCLLHDGVKLFYRDTHHLSYTGAKILLDKIFEAVEMRAVQK